MAAHQWLQTWNGTQLDWAPVWTEGDSFELSAPPALTFIGSLGIGGDFRFVIGLGGAAVASATGAGTIEQTGPMGGQAVASAVGVASLAVGVSLAGGATARAQAVGNLLAAYELTGAALASAQGAATLTATPAEAGVPIGITRRRVGALSARAGTGRRIGKGNA